MVFLKGIFNGSHYWGSFIAILPPDTLLHANVYPQCFVDRHDKTTSYSKRLCIVFIRKGIQAIVQFYFRLQPGQNLIADCEVNAEGSTVIYSFIAHWQGIAKINISSPFSPVFRDNESLVQTPIFLAGADIVAEKIGNCLL